MASKGLLPPGYLIAPTQECPSKSHPPPPCDTVPGNWELNKLGKCCNKKKAPAQKIKPSSPQQGSTVSSEMPQGFLRPPTMKCKAKSHPPPPCDSLPGKWKLNESGTCCNKDKPAPRKQRTPEQRSPPKMAQSNSHFFGEFSP